MAKRNLPNPAELARSRDSNLQGDTFLDTTQIEKPAGLERPGEDMVGENQGEWEEHVLDTAVLDGPDPIDPSGDDPFVPGTPELSGSDLPSNKSSAANRRKQRKDPSGTRGPDYEKEQTVDDRPIGGTTDPHTALTHDSAGFVDEPWKHREDTR